jgi:hypothetical protein
MAKQLPLRPQPALTGIQPSVQLITPQRARELLALNQGNRKVRPHHVKVLARSMKEGLWKSNGAPIMISKSGRLLDGQHRLMALIEADISLNLVIIYNVEDDAYLTLDINMPKSFTDITGNTCLTSAVLGLLYRWENGKLGVNDPMWTPTHQDKLRLLEEHPRLATSMPWGNRTRGVLPGSLAVFCHYIFWLSSAEEADQFFQGLATGENLGKDDTVRCLRERLMRDRSASRMVNTTERMVYVIKAWNAYRQKRPLKQFKWQRDEEFPTIL